MGAKLRPRGAVSLHSDQSGFSLLELMVVIAIVATLSFGAILASNGRSGPSDMSRFQSQFNTQRQLAIVGRDKRGLQLEAKGMRQVLWREGNWDGAETTMQWRGRTVFSGVAVVPFGEPEVIFGFDGQTSAFTLAFADGGQCTSDGWTGLICRDR